MQGLLSAVLGCAIPLNLPIPKVKVFNLRNIFVFITLKILIFNVITLFLNLEKCSCGVAHAEPGRESVRENPLLDLQLGDQAAYAV